MEKYPPSGKNCFGLVKMKSEQEKGQKAADEVARVVSLVMEQSFSMSLPSCQQDDLVL